MNFYMYLWIFIIFLDLLSILSLVFIERRDTTTTWAWLLIIFLFPILGFILYLIFGQNISKEKIFNQKASIDKAKIKNMINYINNDYEDSITKYKDLIKLNLNTNSSIYSTTNKIKTYINGEDKFKDLINDIENDTHFIHIEYYIFRLDSIGKRIIEILKRKVSEGVIVRILIDGMGSSSIKKKEINSIRKSGINISIFFPSIFHYLNLRINYRNHRKIVVIDNKIGYIGGFNVGNEYINKGEKFSFWRDTHIRIYGEAVLELNKRFSLDWEYAAKESIDYKRYFSINKFEHKNNIGIQIISSGPDNLEEYIRNTYIKIISLAKKNIYIQTPYLVLDEPMITSLKIAASSGVDVRIMVPNNPDHFFMAWALSASISSLISSGVKFYKYTKGFIHSKTIVSDSHIYSVGTANFDIRSFKLNFEINALIYDIKFAKLQESIFINDERDCIILCKNDFENRSTKIKILESLSNLIFPIL